MPASSAMFIQKKRILLIDVEKDTSAVLKRCLRLASKYKVVIARGENMGEWLASCQWHKPDAIILDTLTPSVHVFELLRRLKQHRSTVSIPVILLTGVSGYEYRLKAAHLQCEDYVVKPLEMKSFLSRIDAVLQNRGAKTRIPWPASAPGNGRQKPRKNSPSA